MYLDKRRLENGRYEYLVKCQACPDTRWTRDIRGKCCKPCSVKGRTMNYCHVYPSHCRRCSVPMMLRTKPKEDRKPTCDYCKGKYGGRKAMPKEKPIKREVKCSECPEMFEPRSITIKTCSKTCSAARQVRIKREKSGPLMSQKEKKEKREQRSCIKFGSERIVEPKEKKVLGGVDKNNKPVYIRAHQQTAFKFKEFIDEPTDDEVSNDLISKFLKDGGKPSVTFAQQVNKLPEGHTGEVRGGYHGY